MITPINNIHDTIYKTNLNKKGAHFTAHKDFAKIAQNYNIKASCYFRRGTYYGAPAYEFSEVINALKKVFETEGKKDFLIIGIADSQETFSLMAVVKDILENKNLEEYLSLKCIDLQSKPTDKNLYRSSFYDINAKPPYASNSFIYDKDSHGWSQNQHYRVADEIFKFVKNSYSNNSIWNSKAQDAIKNIPNNSFNVISVNNVLPYIRMDGNNVALNTIKHLVRTTKKEGIIITDSKPCVGEFYLNLFCKKIGNGIWQKKYNTDKLSALLG